MRTLTKEPVALTFDGIGQIPEGLEVYLIDHADSRYQNLRSVQEYRFTPALAGMQFTVAVGTHDAMAALLSDVLPKTYALDNNFPNPFNPSTTIPVSVPAAANLSITVYNILGEEVRTLFSGTLAPGRYWMVWDGKNNAGRTVASGVYITRLVAPQGVSVVKKMMMMK
jgi:flagellar hook assembly protein FlgD